MLVFFFANQQRLAHPCRSEQVDHYHLCINLPPPALLIADSSFAPAAAWRQQPTHVSNSSGTEPLVEETEEGLSCLLLVHLEDRWVTAAHTNLSSLRLHKALAAWFWQQLTVWFSCVHICQSHTYSSGFNKVLS